MNDGKKIMSFMAAMSDFFGRLPGQGLKEFGAEVKALTTEDRAYFTAGLENSGYTITAAPSK